MKIQDRRLCISLNIRVKLYVGDNIYKHLEIKNIYIYLTKNPFISRRHIKNSQTWQ